MFVELRLLYNMRLSCLKGGFITQRHNEVRDFTAELLSECCKDVAVEPVLQEITGEQFPPSTITTDDARVDVSARGFWVRGQMAYLDVRVFNPTAKVYLNQTLKAAYKTNENLKKRSYSKRVNLIDQGTFTPLVFTCFGGMARECAVFYNRLSEMIAEKRNEPVSKTKNWIRTRFKFQLASITDNLFAWFPIHQTMRSVCGRHGHKSVD